MRIPSAILRRLAGSLSTRRRSRLAAPLLLLGALAVTGGAYSALAPTPAVSQSADEDLVAEGRALFQNACASCHGANAEGILTDKGGQYGPSLVGVGAASVDFQVGTGRMPMAQPGTQAERKTPVMTEEETEALAAFVASLGPGPAVPEESDYDVSDADNESVVRGGEFFRTNCTACHNFAGTGGALPRGRHAPTLVGVSEKHIYEAMLTGPQQMPLFSDEVLTPESKRDVIAFLKKNEETPSYGGLGLGSFGPVAEGMFAWLVGIGGLVLVTVWIAAHTTRSSKRKGDTA